MYVHEFHSKTLPSDAFPISSSQHYSVSKPQDLCTYLFTYVTCMYLNTNKLVLKRECLWPCQQWRTSVMHTAQRRRVTGDIFIGGLLCKSYHLPQLNTLGSHGLLACTANSAIQAQHGNAHITIKIFQPCGSQVNTSLS